MDVNSQAQWDFAQITQRLAYDSLETRERQESLARLVQRHALPPNVLEIGFGNGYLLRLLAKKDFRCMGIDLSPGNVELTRAEFERDRVGADVRCARIEQTDGIFSAVIACHVLEHFDDASLRSLLLEIYFRLSPIGGVLIGAVPYKQDLELSAKRCPCCGTVFDPDGHLQSFDETRLESFLRDAGFSKVRFDKRVLGYGLTLRTMSRRVKYLLTGGGDAGLQFIAWR